MANKIYAVLIFALLVYVGITAGEELLEGCMMAIDDMEQALPTEPILPAH